MIENMQGWARRFGALAGVLVLAMGCGGESPTPGTDAGSIDTRRNCTQLSAQCGLDDFGNSCGTCPSGRTCSFGVCTGGGNPMCSCGTRVCGVDNCGNSCGSCAAGQTCNASGQCTGGSTMTCAAPISDFGACTATTAMCCGSSQILTGSPTVCTMVGTAAVCLPTCSGPNDCVTVEQRLRQPVGSLTCTALTDGRRVCNVQGNGCTQTIGAFAACTVGVNDRCCGYTPNGTPTLCTGLASGALAFCNPRCTTNADCDRESTRPGTYTCQMRNDGQRVCAPR